MSKKYKGRELIKGIAKSGAVPVSAFLLAFWGGYEGLEHIYFEQPDTNRGPNYEETNKSLQSQYNAFAQNIIKEKELRNQLSYVDITEEANVASLQSEIKNIETFNQRNIHKFISNVYISASLSEQDTMDYIAQLQNDGLSDFAEKFRIGAEFQPAAGGMGWHNTLHDAHAYLRECRADKISTYRPNKKEQYLESIYSCMQNKDYNQIDITENFFGTVCLFATYALLLPFSLMMGGLGNNITKSYKFRSKLQNWADGKTNLLPRLKPPVKH